MDAVAVTSAHGVCAVGSPPSSLHGLHQHLEVLKFFGAYALQRLQRRFAHHRLDFYLILARERFFGRHQGFAVALRKCRVFGDQRLV
jgi:hypothetical protein